MNEETYRKHVATVYRICLLYLKNPQEAEDETANVFLALIQAGKTFDSEGHEKAWLITTAKNRCRNVLASSWYKKRVWLDILPEEMHQDNQYAALWEGLQTSKESQRIVLYLHYFEGYQTEEIAKMLSIKPSTLRSRLVQARAKLKEILQEDAIHE